MCIRDRRFLDWNIYARLERLFIKLFLQEEDLHVSILLDASRSMDWGSPAKGLYAKRVAAALAYIGLCNYDRISVYAWRDDLAEQITSLRGRSMMHRLIDFLQKLPLDGPSNMTRACRSFAVRHPQPGVLVMLSDLLDKGGFETGLRYLLRRDLDIYLIQILSPQELQPELAGDLKLRDIEDGETAEITVSRALLERYRRRLHAYCDRLRSFCTRRGLNYLFATTDLPFDQLVLTYLRRKGLLR